MDQPFDVRGEKPREVAGQEVEDDEPFRQAAREREDRVDVVVRRARPQLGLGQPDSDALEVRRDDQLARPRQDAKPTLVDELGADVGHVREQRRLVQRLGDARGIGPGAAVVGMRGREQRDAVADDRCDVGGAEVQDVGALDFLELGERFLELQVGRIELRLVEQVIDGLAGDGVAQRHLDMHERPGETFAGVVVELGGGTLVLEEGQRHEGHLGRSLDRHVRLVRLEDFVPLPRDHVVRAADVEQAGEKLGTDLGESYGHRSSPPYATPPTPARKR